MDTFCLYKHSGWICLHRMKVIANPIRLTQYIFRSLSFCHHWVSVVTFMVHCCVKNYFTPSFWLLKPREGSLMPPVYFIFIDSTSLRPSEKRNAKLPSLFTKTLNHFQVHGSCIRRRSPFLKTVWLCTARVFLVSWFWKWMPLCFGFDPLNNLLCNYILYKSLCVHSGPFGILCSIAVTTRALTKSKLKPTL